MFFVFYFVFYKWMTDVFHVTSQSKHFRVKVALGYLDIHSLTEGLIQTGLHYDLKTLKESWRKNLSLENFISISVDQAKV